MPPKDEIAASHGESKFRITGKLAIFLTALVVIVSISAFAYLKKDFDLLQSERTKQFNAFNPVHQFVIKLVNAWDELKDITNIKKSNVRFLRKHVTTVAKEYEALDISKLNTTTKIARNWHLAILKTVQADLYGEYRYIREANELLNQAESMSHNTDSLSEEEKELLRKQNIKILIKKSQINAFALGYYIGKNMDDLNMAKQLLEEIGGCPMLSDETFYHIKIANTINCPLD
ncbi:hypothetical protein SG34_007145 [Thalassomonas viridans]|uniref:Uncharacterized protein n=1 Tax=Thalassomonas viridans TaxID=137584 RepID=A0AAF0CAA8_9GAMM|nr:hypothetical protein [Thalassomonas viridans]WDE06673.1 hypothetical protein SG34_007145 [Thalassomonas viridans]